MGLPAKAAPGSNLEQRAAALESRVLALEAWKGVVASRIDSAFLIGAQQRSGRFGAMVASGSSILDSQGLIGVASVLVNGGTQTGGPIVGVAGPPTGLSGTGGEVVLTTGTFTLQRQAPVMLLAICTDFVLCTVAFQAAHPVYFQIDGIDITDAYADLPCWANPGNAETRGLSATILKIATLAAGPHTVNVIWNSIEGNKDTIHNVNNPLFAFLLGS